MALVYRDLRTQLDDAQSVLLPRLTDNRLSRNEQSKVQDVVTEIVHVKLNVPLNGVFVEADRQYWADILHVQVAALSTIDVAHADFTPYEFYNAGDLLDTAAICIEDGVNGCVSDL